MTGIDIEAKTTCNLACPFCYGRSREKNSVPVEKVLKACEGVRGVTIYGGELLEDEDYAKTLLTELNARKCKIHLVTNGFFIDRSASLLASCEKLSVQISVEPEEWGIRVSKGEHILKRLINAKSVLQSLNCSFHTVIPCSMEVPYCELKRYIDTLISIKKCHMAFHPETSKTSLSLPRWMDAWFSDNRKLLVDNAYKEFNLFYHRYKNLRGTLLSNCSIGSSFSLGPDGQIYTCHEAAFVKNSNWLRNKTDFLDLIKKFDTVDCRYCEAKYQCGGCCYASLTGLTQPVCQFYSECASEHLRWLVNFSPHKFTEYLKLLETEDLKYLKLFKQRADVDYVAFMHSHSLEAAINAVEVYSDTPFQNKPRVLS